MSLSEVIAWVNGPAVTLFGIPVSWAEALGFATGALCVWLVARQRVANWPVGIANNVFFLVLFTSAGLYADAGLQVVYVALALYGWWQWLFGGRAAGLSSAAGSRLSVARTTRPEWFALGAVGVAGTLGLHLLLDRATDSTVPFWDAVTTVLSLLATYGQCRKRVESWWFWIAADLIYIPLYAYKGLWLTALLYLVFLALCAFGLRSWLADLRRDRVPVGVAA